MVSERRVLSLITTVGLLAAGAAFGAERPVWEQADHNGELARQCLMRSRDYVRGWLAHADPVTGLSSRMPSRSRQTMAGPSEERDSPSAIAATRSR